jgi:phage gpG-like protein
MRDVAGIFSNIKTLIQKMTERRKAMEPNSPELRAALTRIGVNISNRAKVNAIQKRVFDQGALVNSLGYVIDGSKVTIGSFGVRYARFHEFGANLHPGAVRAMFAAMRERGGPKRASKGVLTFKGDGSATLKARPYLMPAFETEKARTMAIIREYAAGRK